MDPKTSGAPAIKVIFLHHSTGANLMKEGNVRELFQQQKSCSLAFWDHGYDPQSRGRSLSSLFQPHIYGLRNPAGVLMPTSFHIPRNNTDPAGLAQLFSQESTNPPANALSHMLCFDVLIFKSCFPVTAIASEEQLQTYQKHYITIRESIERYPTRLFIPMTPPPLRASMTTPQQAKRARRFANWLMSAAYHEDRPYLQPYDLFGQLATAETEPLAHTLRPEFCRSALSDSHPNALANRTVAPHWVSFVCATVNQAAYLTHPPDRWLAGDDAERTVR
jgi:hypothetical protein